MGRVARWIRSILGMRKHEGREDASISGHLKDRKRDSFAKSSPKQNIPSRDAMWQNKHAIAVAVATAAAAEAAVAAAKAARAVLILTRRGVGGARETWGAVAIQTAFRGFLARKALRALRGLVKLQALVRGYLVRKRTAQALHRMQALIRAQLSVRSDRARRSLTKYNPRKSAHEARCEFDEIPRIVEVDTIRSRPSRVYTSASESSEDPSYQNLLLPQFPFAISGRYQNFAKSKWKMGREECRFSTAQNTPRFANLISGNPSMTPSKSVCGDFYSEPYTSFPKYMAKTQSFRAKLRSYSAPKQRPDPEPEPEPEPRRKMTLNDIMASRNSLSSVRLQRQVQEELNAGY